MTESTDRHAQTVAVIGLGYVGLPLALLASQKGYQVKGIDIDSRKLDLIRQKKSPFIDLDIDRQLQLYPLEVSGSFAPVHESEIVVICVPTPVFPNRLPDYRPVESACRSIAPFLKDGALVVLESTVNPGVCEELMIPILESTSGLRAGNQFFVAHCPERINPGDKHWNVSNISRVVGGLDQTSLQLAVRFYSSVISAHVRPMGSLKEAEAVKVVENSFRNINIAFVNELAQSFALMGIDVNNVINGAATKPFSFLPHYPGCGIGGHCIPVDPYYLIDYARKKYGFDHTLLEMACRKNESMPDYTADLVEEGLRSEGCPVKGAMVAVLGLAYKADIGDCRESPSFALIKALSQRGFTVRAFDPYVPDKSDTENLTDALSGSAAVVVATDHAAFRGLTGSEVSRYGIRVVVDGRNCLNKDGFVSAGLYYAGIGR